MNKTITVNGRQYTLNLTKNVFSNKYSAELFGADGKPVAHRDFKNMKEIQMNLKVWIITADYELQSVFEKRVMRDLIEWDGEIAYDTV